MRLIDADDLRQVLEVFSEKDSLGHTPVQLCDAMPTIDAVEVVHGNWEVVDQEEPRRYGCSVCRKLSFYETNYCSYCGAKMKGERRDND